MNKLQKSNLITSLKEKLVSSAFIAVIHYRGMNDNELYNMRVALKSKGCNIKIAKNTLLKVAIKGTNLEPISTYLNGPTAILYSEDPISLSKIISDTKKKVELLKIVTAFYKNSFLSETNVNELAKLGSMEEVRASFIGILKGAQSNFVRVLSAPEMGLANLKTQ